MFVSHSQDTIERICNRCIFLNKGYLLFDGEPAEAFLYYDHYMKGVKLKNLQPDSKKIDLTLKTRPVNGLPLNVRMTKLELLEHAMWKFQEGGKLRFILTCEGLETTRNIDLRITILTENGNPVTMSTSGHILFIEKGQKKRFECALDLSQLVPATYKATISMSELVLSDNQLFNLDVLKEVVSFSIAADPQKLKWTPEWWGNVRSPE